MAYLDQMYSQTAPTGAAPTGMSQYKPAKGIWQEYDNQYMGDYQGQDTRQPWEKGFWKVDPNANYGQSPGENFGQMFDPKTGDHIGWQEKGLLSAGGSGLFGSFGKEKSLMNYGIDPTTGQLMAPTQTTVTPSKSGMTNFMSYAVPIGMAAGLGAGAAGGAFSGAGSVAGAAPEAAGLTASSADVLGGVYGTAGESLVGGELIGQAAGASGGSFLTTVQDLVSQGMDVQSAVSKAKSLVSTQGESQGKPGGQSIIDLLGAYYSGKQLKDLSGNLKGMYSDQRGLQNPYNDLLRASYQDPNVFYGSNHWKGLESVYQNKIDRLAAKGGTNANTIDREVKLNNYAMQELEKFRGGLKDAVNAYDPTRLAPIAEKGYNNEAYANTGSFATASRGGSGANVAQTWDTIKNTASTAEDVWNFVSKWF